MSFLPDDNERLQILLGFSFGFGLLICFFVLALIIGLGHVAKESSFGLELVLQAMGMLGGLFGGWAFRSLQGKKE